MCKQSQPQNNERSQLVVSCVKGGALELYLKEIYQKMLYKMAVNKLRAGYNTPNRKLSLQSEVDSLNFDEFTTRHQIQDEKECLHRMVEYLNTITPQLWMFSILNRIR